MTDDLADFDPDDVEAVDDEEDENYVRIKKSDFVKTRKAARKRGEAIKELAGYKRQALVRDAGLEGLTERQINLLAAEAGENPTSERLRELAVELKWAEPPAPTEEQQQTDSEIAAHAQAAEAVSGQPAAQRTQIPATDLAEWPPDKLMRFNESHPELYELALQGEPISLPAGFN